MEMMFKNVIENQSKIIKEENKSLHEKIDNCHKTITDLNSKIEVLTDENRQIKEEVIELKEENQKLKEEVKELIEEKEERKQLIESVNSYQFSSCIQADIEEGLDTAEDSNILQNQVFSYEARLNTDQFEFIKNKQSEFGSDNEDYD